MELTQSQAAGECVYIRSAAGDMRSSNSPLDRAIRTDTTSNLGSVPVVAVGSCFCSIYCQLYQNAANQLGSGLRIIRSSAAKCCAN